MPNLFSPNGDNLKVGTDTDYDPGITEDIDRQIRHMPAVVGHCLVKAAETLRATGSTNFDLIIQDEENTQRPRAYVFPKNNKGIHEELADAVLLKAALGMEGK